MHSNSKCSSIIGEVLSLFPLLFKVETKVLDQSPIPKCILGSYEIEKVEEANNKEKKKNGKHNLMNHIDVKHTGTVILIQADP